MARQFCAESTAPSPVPRLDVEAGSVHVWTASLDQPDSRLVALEALLSSDERARGARLRRDIDRQRFVARRGLLRVILGSYLGCAPEEIALRRGFFGKPELAPSTSDGSLTFNLSYSHEIAMFAVGREQEIGVDVERQRTALLHAELANRYFSAPERVELRKLPADSVATGFFNGWTRKEAYIKAIGTGLFTRLDSFAVTLTPGEPVRLRTPAPDRPGRWSLTSLDAVPGYAAALTVEGECGPILNRHWPESWTPAAQGARDAADL